VIRNSDVRWWILEARKHPESAPTIIEELAKRLAELDAENERLRDEIIRLQRRAPVAAEGPKLSNLRERVATLERLLSGEASTEPWVVFLSNRLQSARVPLSQVHHLAREGRPVLGQQAMLGLCQMLLVPPQADLLLFTSQWRGYRIPLSDVPLLAEADADIDSASVRASADLGPTVRSKARRSAGVPSASADDWPAGDGPGLAADERLTAAVAVKDSPRFWTLVTRRGHVQQLIRIDFDRRVERGERLLESPFRNDRLVGMCVGDEGDLLLLTRWGKGVRFPQRAIPTSGALGLDLEPDDEVVAALSLQSEIQVLVLTASGYAVQRNSAQFKARSSPGGTGKSLIQAYDVLNLLPRVPDAALLYLTYAGKLTLVPVADIPVHQRSRKGTRVHVFDRDPAVAVALVPTS